MSGQFACPYFRFPLFFLSLSLSLSRACSFSLPIRIMPSPYRVANYKYNVSEHTADRIEQQIIHIKAPHPGNKLKSFHKEAQSKTIEQRQKETSVPACHRHKKSKRYKNQYIAKQIRICDPTKPVPVIPKSIDFLKQNQIIMIFSHFSGSSIPVRKDQKIQ